MSSATAHTNTSSTPITKGIVLYSSSTPFSVAQEKNTERVRYLLDQVKAKKGGEYQEIYVDLSPADKEYLHNNSEHASNKRTLPQVFVDGKYVGDKDAIDELNEFGELAQALGISA